MIRNVLSSVELVPCISFLCIRLGLFVDFSMATGVGMTPMASADFALQPPFSILSKNKTCTCAFYFHVLYKTRTIKQSI